MNLSMQNRPQHKMKKSFSERVYDALLHVPRGKVTTYKDLANALGTTAYRAVGQALRCNPYAPRVPCHRVVASDGTLGGFQGKRSGPALLRKRKLLEAEGIHIHGKSVMDFEKKRHRF
jgi:methylated-DNA-[protein]-cysteine S-methyltransferase